MSACLFIQLLMSAITIAFILFSIESHDQAFNVTFLLPLVAVIVVLITLFMYCKLSENITCDLYAIGDIFYESAWYRLTVKQQQMFVLPVQRAQSKFRLTGLGIFECSLETYLTVSVEYKSFHMYFPFLLISIFSRLFSCR